MDDILKQFHQKKLEFIDFVMSMDDENLPIDTSIQIDMIQFRLDEIEECIEERFDIIEKKLNSIMKYLDSKQK
jgi:hypothetical protein